jgi:5-methylcytosine-specific restriction protein A
MPLRPPQHRPANYRSPVPKIRNAYYASAAWIALRASCLVRDGNRCTQCTSTHRLAPHHIVERALGGADVLSNLITLCAACHNKTHGKRGYQLSAKPKI